MIKIKQPLIPLWYLLFFPIVMGLDLYTTYLGSPDLRHEANPIVRTFHLNWGKIIIYDVILILVILFSILLSANYIIRHQKAKSHHKSVGKILFYISCCIIVFFYSVFWGSCFASINNYFSYLYLYTKTNNLFYSIAMNYVDFYKKFSVTANLIAYYLICTFIGISITTCRINQFSDTEKR